MRRSTLAEIKRRARGFTLIELGIVVTIIGILAVVAIVGYRKMVLNSKINEARTMINAIRLAEEDYKAESGGYLDLRGVYCPSTGLVPDTKWAWESDCNNKKWRQLPVHADGPVQFGYMVWADTTVGQPSGVSQSLIDLTPRLGQTVPYYVVHAQADLDPQSTGGKNTELASSSFSGHIYSINEGE